MENDMISLNLKQLYDTIPVVVTKMDYRANTKKTDFGSLLHNHKEFEIMYVTGGEALYLIDSVEYKIKKGDIVLAAPYIVHKLFIDASKDFANKCIFFDLNIINDANLSECLEKGLMAPTPIVTANATYAKDLIYYIDNAHLAAGEKSAGWELAVKGNLTLLFFALKSKDLLKMRAASGQNDFCHKVLNYIDKNYKRQLTSRDVADALFINNSYFCRKFKQNFGITFQKHLELYRIEKAKLLLKATDSPISEIAQNLGFGGFSYFSQIFKNITKKSPSEYRKHSRKQ